MGFSNEFLGIVALVLGLDLFIGLATMGRVATATSEDIRFLQGMNRLRHAYHETVPGLEPYFITGHYETCSASSPTTAPTCRRRTWRSIVHGFTTVVGMLGGDQRRAHRRRRRDARDPGPSGRTREAIAIGVGAFILVLSVSVSGARAPSRDGGGPPAPVPQPGRLTGDRRESNAPGDAGGAGVALRRGGATWRGAAASRPCGDRLTRPWRSISVTTTMTSSPTDTTSSTLGTW